GGPVGGPMVYYPAGPSADYDGDGRIDLCLINWFRGNHTRLLRNVSKRSNHWLAVRVRGRGKVNRMGLGSLISVYAAGRLGDAESLLGRTELNIGYGYASGQVAEAHFGLGKRRTVDLRVVLPDGTAVEKSAVTAGQRLVIEAP
ncbi:MAG: ASPIC/UnbV domain-containing protein, partial [Phycisphaeraceae bacterium]|nr:ASPIC/UnbV domain-containing protein [Phycisphaeraceae bacterium]